MLVDLIKRLLDIESKRAFFDIEQRLLENLREEESKNTNKDSEERVFRNVDTVIYS
jgi:hypothetical protein